MNAYKFVFGALFLVGCTFTCFAQLPPIKSQPLKQTHPVVNQAAKASPAYAEVLLQKTEFEAQLEDLLVSFTADFPKVKELRFQLGLIQKQLDRILEVGSGDAGKLSAALGRLIVRKVELETELWNLRAQYNDDFPDVKKAKRKVEVFDKAINEILP